MSGKFKDFMKGEKLYPKRQRINWHDIATKESMNRYQKPYEELTEEEQRHIARVLSGLERYW